MITLFEVHKHGPKGLSVCGLELQDGQYLLNFMPSFRNYTWEDTITINIIKLATINKCIDYKVIPHTESLEDSTVFQFDYDGMHEIVRIILPTFEWYLQMLEYGLDILNKLKTVVYFKDGKVVKNGKIIEMEELERLDCKDSTIVRGSKCVFNDYYIKQCYLETNKNILKEVRKCKVDKQEMFKRDILFMAINCILYALDINLLYEALNILEDLVLSCSEICNNYKPKPDDCGCNR